MLARKLIKQIVLNKEKITAHICFGSLSCFNLLLLINSIYRMFTFDGDIVNIKEYVEIQNITAAHNIFLHKMLASYLYGLLYAFPLVWSYFFVRRINLNAVLIQLLPTLVCLGIIYFSK